MAVCSCRRLHLVLRVGLIHLLLLHRGQLRLTLVQPVVWGLLWTHKRGFSTVALKSNVRF